MKPSPAGGRDPQKAARFAPPPEISPAGLAFCLFSLSFSTVLFTLAIFRLLSFFIMPSLFFDLLFIGFPVGAFLGARFFRIGPESFRRTLWILIGAALLSTLSSLLCKQFDYLRAHIFEVEIPMLLGQIAVFTGLFIPYFCAYGLSEYIGYQWGRQKLKGRMRLVYAIYLFGAAGAYFFLRWGLGALGISAMIGLAFTGIAAPVALLDRRRWYQGAAVAAAGLLGFIPAVEKGFLQLYKGTSSQSSKHIELEEGAKSLSQEWGRYSFCELLWSPVKRSYKGLYNDFFQWEYAPGAGFAERSLGAVPLWVTPPGGSVAIIGAGGGRQVRYAQRFGFRKILAIEIEPAVIRAVRGPFAGGFDRVYEAPGTEVQVTEARSFMERTGELFDLIYLPSVGGYPQMMLEPGNMIRTYEAYRLMRDRLKPGGILAIWYPAGLDEMRILTDQYVRTLRALGMEAVAYEAVQRSIGRLAEFLILASKPAPGEDPAEFPRALKNLPELKGSEDPGADFLKILKRFFISLPSEERRTEGIAAFPEIDPRELPVMVDPIFTPITDEKPFLAGNVQAIFPMEMVYDLFAILGGVLLAASAAVVGLLRRKGDPGIPGRPYWKLAVVSALIGANFLLAEHYLVLALFQQLFVYYDSLILGAICFLILTGLGSILITPRLRIWFAVLGVLALGALLALQLGLAGRAGIAVRLTPELTLLLFAPVAFVTGSFFPGIFELAARNPLGVFAMDAVGAAFGSLAAFFLPIAFGFRSLFIVSAAAFLLTALFVGLFFRNLPEPGPDRPATPG